jgi:hypothetical protein
MQSFATSLVLSIAVIASLLQNVIAAVSSQTPSNATAEQLENQKRSFSIGYVSF